MGLTDAERDLTARLRDLSARLASGEKIEATRVKTCTNCGGVGTACPICGGSGFVRERVELVAKK